MSRTNAVLLVDLNNFARYPTLAIGYMAAILRSVGMSVRVYSPLMVGVGGVTRETRPHRFSLMTAKLNHHLATSRSQWVRDGRDRLAAGRISEITSHHASVIQ